MIRAGLCSIAFRSCAPEEVLRLACEAGLAGLEWGGDVHVPPGDERHAERVGRLTREAGLAVAAYGSYFRLGDTRPESPPLAAVLATARALGAPVLRVWAGAEDAERTPRAEWERIAEAARACVAEASAAGLRVACEWHMGTLTSTNTAARALLDAVPGLLTYWQPAHWQDDAYCLAGLESVRERLAHVHVFHWWPSLHERHPLAEGAERWRRFLGEAARAPGERFALLELLGEASVERLKADAATLRALIATVEERRLKEDRG